MKTFYDIKRNKLYRALALGGLMTCITSMAAIDSAALKANNIVNSNATLHTIKAANSTQVFLNETSALYVFRHDDSYYFWSINDTGTLLKLLDKVTLDMSQPQEITVNLHPDTAGLFYADNLVMDPQTTFNFKGQLTAGKIAIPLSKDAFIPLLDAAPDVQQPVIIDGNTPELLDTVAVQEDIYSTAESTLVDVQNHMDATLEVMANSVLTYKDILIAEATYADNLMQSYETSKVQLEADFLSQANADVAYIEQQVADLQVQTNIEIANFEKNSLPCIEQVKKTVESSTAELAKTIEQIEREFDEDPKLEAEIERVSQSAEQSAAQIDECVAGIGSLEQFNIDGLVDQLTYQQLGDRAESLAQQVDTEMTQWESDLQALPDNLMLGLQTDELAARTEAFESRFNEWISSAYQDKNGFITNPVEASKSMAEKDSDEIAWLEKVANKGQEQLCHDDIGNFDFNITGIGVVIGTPWNDRIITGSEANLVLALTGDDCVETHDGVDLVLGMPGRDMIFLGDHHDIAHGGWGTDFIVGSAGRSYTFSIAGVDFEVDLGNFIIGGADDDFLFGGETFDPGEDGVIEADGFTDIVLGDTFLFGQAAGNDIIDGQSGIDFLFGQRGNDNITNLGSGVITVAAVPVEFGSYFWGNAGDDTITGSNTPMLLSSIGDFIFGGDGDDTFNANTGRDFAFGADGNDNGTGGGGNDFVFGGPGEDSISGGDGIDFVFGGLDNDNVFGGNGLDFVQGNEGNDRVFGEDGPDWVMGNRGNDTVSGGNSFDLVVGGPGQDFMLGDDGWDFMLGGDGQDNMSGNAGWDLMFGGNGTDNMNGNDGNDFMFGNTNDEDGIEIMRGGDNLDIMWGNDGREQMFGDDGIDVIWGNAGNDEISGGIGLDVIWGNDGNDEINGNADPDAMFGGNGNDTINGDDGIDFAQGNNGCDIMNGGNGADLFFGNDHDDTITGGVSLDLLFGGNGVDQIFGQQGIDFLSGGGGRDRLEGGDQLDVINGNDGDDFMQGGNGLDVMSGQGGNDFMNGGNDTDLMMGGNGNDNINGANGNDMLFGGSNNDRINSGNNTDFTFAGDGNDRIRAVEGRNFAFGNGGSDVLDANQAGNGWEVRDFLFGNSGNDNLTGDGISQRDLLAGGSGSDNRVRNTTWVTTAEFNGTWVTPAPNCN